MVALPTPTHRSGRLDLDKDGRPFGRWHGERGGRCTGCRAVVAVNVWLGPRKTVIGTAWGRAVEGLEEVAGGRDTEEKTDERGVVQPW